MANIGDVHDSINYEWYITLIKVYNFKLNIA